MLTEGPMNTTSSRSSGDSDWDAITHVATEYLQKEKAWQPSDFRLEDHGVTSDGRFAVVYAIHADDERNPVPGGGRSLELHIDRATRTLIREYGFQ